MNRKWICVLILLPCIILTISGCSSAYRNVIDMSQSMKFSDSALLDEMNKICLDPPKSIPFDEYRDLEWSIHEFSTKYSKELDIDSEQDRIIFYTYVEYYYYYINVMVTDYNYLAYNRTAAVPVPVFNLMMEIQNMSISSKEDSPVSLARALEGLDRMSYYSAHKKDDISLADWDSIVEALDSVNEKCLNEKNRKMIETIKNRINRMK